MVPVNAWWRSRLASAGVLAVSVLIASSVIGKPAAAPAQAAVLPIATAPATSMAAIVVTGTATIDITPDVARIMFSIQTTALGAAQAESSNATVTDRVRTLVARAGVASSDIKTLSLQVWPQYDYRSGQSVLNGFMATNTLQATVHDLARIGAVIDAAVAGGATAVEGVSYDTNDHSAAGARAMAAAVKDAQVKARAMADAAGVRLGSVVSITDVQTTPYPFPVLRGAAAAVPTQGGTQVSPPDIQLSESVTVGWTIG
jgi:uncharacterized protein YggE